MMKYEEPNLEIIVLNTGNIVTLSVEGSGTGEDTTGPWG